MVSQKTNREHTGQETHFHRSWEKVWKDVWQRKAKMLDRSRPTHIKQSEIFQHECICSSLTLRVLSTSPQGNLFKKSMPVRGVPVGGSKMDASIIRYSTFSGLFYTHSTHKHRNKNINHSMSLLTLVQQTLTLILLTNQSKTLLDFVGSVWTWQLCFTTFEIQQPWII